MKIKSIARGINSVEMLLLPGLACLVCGISHGFDRLSIAIEESGPASNPDVLVRVETQGLAFRGPLSVIAPSGEPLELVTNAPIFSVGTWEGEFDSLSEALGFITGDWAASYPSSQTAGTDDSERITRNIEVLPVSETDVARSAPTLMSPVAGGLIADGRESLFEWEYETPPADSSYISIMATEFGLGTTRVLDTPTLSGGASGRNTTRAGDVELSIGFREDPQATTNRWLYEIDASDQHLPLDLSVQLGGFTELRDFLRVDGEPVDFSSNQSLTYVRFADPVAVTLVPEPTTQSLLVLLGLLGLPAGGWGRSEA